MRELSCESLLTAYTDDDLVFCQGTMLSISEEPGSFSSIQSDLDLAQHASASVRKETDLQPSPCLLTCTFVTLE